MIDFPSSDFVTDFLIVDPETKLNLWPHLVYDSSNGTNPLNVSSCNASIASETGSQIKVRIAIFIAQLIMYLYKF